MKTAFLFAGQGAQSVGMGQDFYEQSAACRELYRLADSICGFSVSDICFAGPQEQLDQTIYTQPCLLAAELAAWLYLKEQGIMAAFVAGYSLGEWAALVAAGVISAEDAFSLVAKRAEYMQKAVKSGTGKMIAVLGISQETAQDLCARAGGDVWISNYNCPQQYTISGETHAVERLLELSEEAGISAVPVAVSVPSHCPLMEPAARKLAQELDACAFRDAQMPVFLNYDGRAEMDAEKIKEKVILQITSPVQFVQTFAELEQANVEQYIEIGPGRTLSGFVKRTLGVKAARAGTIKQIQKLGTSGGNR